MPIDPSQFTVKVLNIQILNKNGNGSLLAFADIQIGSWIIRNWRLIKENGKRPLIVSPQMSWKDANGAIRYKTLITLPDDLKGQIDFAILKCFTEELEKVNGKQS